MKLHYKTFLAILIACLFSIMPASAQKNDKVAKYHWGFFGDYNYTMHSTTNDGFTVYKYDDLNNIINPALGFPWFQDGTGHGFSIGGLFEWHMNKTFTLGATLGYSLMNGEFYDDKNVSGVYLNGQMLDKVVSRDYFKPSLSTINFMPYLSGKIYKGLYAKLGLNFGTIISNSANEYQEITSVEPEVEDVWFDDTKTKKSKENDIDIDDGLDKFQFGIALGLGYEIPISEGGALLVPEIKYNLGITNIATDIANPVFVDKKCDWKASNFSAGLAVKFPIFAEENISRATTDRDYYLSADLKTYGIDLEGKRMMNPQVIVEEFETEEVFPMLTNIYFVPGKSSINDTRVKRLDDIGVSNFREEDLRADAIAINRDILNLIAYRMYEYEDAKVVITGYSNIDGEDTKNPNIAMERANAVKTYMIQVWGIKADRISVKEDKAAKRSINPKSLNDYIQENAKASIEPADKNSYALFEPLRKIFIDKVSNPPMVEFNTAISAEAGLDNYRLTVSQKGNTVTEFSGVATAEIIPWTVKNVNLNEKLNVVLSATDLQSQNVVVDDQISIDYVTLKSKRSSNEGDYKVDRYSLLLFDYDKAEVSNQDKLMLQTIKKTINPEAKVIISGYADRAGDSAYNKRLAQKRCEEVNKILGVKSAKVRAYGNDILIFDNSTPEGRALSRTVRVEIYTPVK